MLKTSKGKKYFVKTGRNMFNLDADKVEFALSNRALVFWQGKKAKNIVYFIILCRDSLSLFAPTLGTAKFKQLDQA